MPKINHRRGETREFVYRRRKRDSFIGYWNRDANRAYRGACRQILREAMAGHVEFEDLVLPQQDEVDNIWNYD